MLTVTALVVAAPAHAGVYRVWTCRAPNGSPAPISDASSGWIPSLRAGTTFMTLDDRCPSGGGIHAHLGGVPAQGAGGYWTFTPPSGTSLGGFSVTWSGSVSGGGEATLSRSDQPDPVYVERNGGSFGSHAVTQSGFDIASVTAIAACSFAGSGTCGADPVDFTIARAVMTLNDFHAPQATDVSGDLVGGGPLRGTMSVSFSGSDQGGGLYRVVVTADGADTAAAGVPDASGRCASVDPSDVHGFEWPQPCPLDVRTTVSLDTGGVPEGTHTVGVYLEDAAGNRTPRAAPAARQVIHRGALNGVNGGDGASLVRVGRYRVTTSFAGRRPVLRGTLTRGGQPIVDAVLNVLAKNRTIGAAMRTIAQVRTDLHGNYRVRAPAGPSRLLRVGYKAYLADPDYAAHTDVTQRVHAGVVLSARTHRVALRGTARFSGRVRGGFVPRRGKLIELQAFDAGRWRTFDTLRTGRSGRFRAHYAFKRVGAPRSYRFRARARYERGYPFLLGVSHTVRVRVG